MTTTQTKLTGSEVRPRIAVMQTMLVCNNIDRRNPALGTRGIRQPHTHSILRMNPIVRPNRKKVESPLCPLSMTLPDHPWYSNTTANTYGKQDKEAAQIQGRLHNSLPASVQRHVIHFILSRMLLGCRGLPLKGDAPRQTELCAPRSY